VNRAISGVFWIGLYLLVVLIPLFLMLMPPVPSGRSFWLELSVALGFVGLTQIAVQFVLIARFRRITAPYGIDIILRYHRQIALVAVTLILLHPVIIVIENPSRLVLLNPFRSNISGRLGLLAVAALLTTVVISVFRERLKLSYERWRFAHLLLGVSALVLAQAHVSLTGLYTNTFWKHAVWIVSAVLMAGLALYLRVIKPLRQRNYTWQVAEVRPSAATRTCSRWSRWSTAACASCPDSSPGSSSRAHRSRWRSIRSACAPAPSSGNGWSSASRRSAISPRAWPTSRSGTRAFLDGPHGAFSIDRYPAVGYVFIAGGIGISPIMSFLHTMADRSDPRPVLLIYADKTWDDVAFRDELAELSAGALDLRVVYVLEEPPDDWDGGTGFVTRELLERELPREDFPRQYFVCGPPPMMDAVHAALLELGVPADRIQLERFVLI
jgi:predicted ferric reductase